MSSDFARSLSLLRHERKISQRSAAQALGISQALLSHYENGVREPGLQFVVKVCDYYNVSADFLLGRTLSRDGTTILDADSLYNVADERDSALRGTVLATLSKKLIINSVSVVFDLLGRLGSKRAIQAARRYLSAVIYVLYRHLHQNGGGKEGFFSVPREYFVAGLPRADMILAEAEYVAALVGERKAGAQFPSLSHDELSDTYPGTYQSLLQTIHTCGERLNREISGQDDPIA